MSAAVFSETPSTWHSAFSSAASSSWMVVKWVSRARFRAGPMPGIASRREESAAEERSERWWVMAKR